MLRTSARARWAWALLCLTACQRPAKVQPVPQKDPKSAASADAPAKGEQPPDLEGSPFPLTLWAAFLAQRDYVEPARFSNAAQVDSALSALEAEAPKVFARRDGETVRLEIGDWSRSYPMPAKPGMRQLAPLIVQILADCVRELKLEGKERHELEYAAFNGLLHPLDPHTLLLTPEQNASLGVRTRGHFGGIGAEIWAEDRRIRIVRVLPGTPAEKAGMMDDDVVYRIDDRSTVNMSASEAQRLLRGPVDSKVKVIVQRKKQLRTLTITRGKIEIPAIMALDLPNETGYVELLSFQQDGAKDVLQAMKKQLDGGAKALVLDLRRNSGGLLNEALALVDGLVKDGELIAVLSREGKEVEKAKTGVTIPESVPLVVLISQSSASASEIVSGALAKLGRAVVVGRRSFGKGSVQQLFSASPYGEELALKLTIAEYRVSGDTKIQGRGVVPTVALYPMQLGDHRGVGAFFDVERFDEGRENKVYGRNDETPPDPSPFSLRYLARTPWQKPFSKTKDKAARAWRDPELQIAAKLARRLQDAGSTDAAGADANDVAKAAGTATTQHEQATGFSAVTPQRKSIISTFVKEQAKEQEQALVKALGRWKVDWRAAKDATPVRPEDVDVSVRLIKVEPSDSGPRRRRRKKAALDPQHLRNGEVFTLRLTVSNRSDRPLNQISARTSYFLPELDDIEMVLGKIPVRGKRSIDLRLQVTPGRAAHVGELEFSVYAGNTPKDPIRTESIQLGLESVAAPELEYSYWIVDDPKLASAAPPRPKREVIEGEEPFVVQGDGNGLADPGEKVLVAVEVVNRGRGEASIPSIVARNTSREQALLEEGAAPLDTLGPGERAYASIAMTVSPKADPTKPIDLELLVGDRKTSRVVERDLHLALQEGPRGAKWQRSPAPAWVQSEQALDLRAFPDPAFPVLGQLQPRQRIAKLGTFGPWTALAAGKARLVWVKTPDTGLAPAKRRRKSALKLASMVVPPKLELEIPTRSGQPSLAIRGRAQDDEALENIVVWAVPNKRGQEPRKLFYGEVDAATQSDARREMSIATKLELNPGPQRIRVVVRDNDKVETKRDYWVHLSDSTQAARPLEGQVRDTEPTAKVGP